MRERIRDLYWSGSLHSDLRLQQPHPEVVSDESAEDMQFSVSTHSQEAGSQTDGVTENTANLIRRIDFGSTEEAPHPQAVSDEEGSRYHRSKSRVHRGVDKFTMVKYVGPDSDSDDESYMHHSSRRDEDRPPKKKRMLQSRDDSSHESERSAVTPKSTQKRKYWAGKASNERLRQDP